MCFSKRYNSAYDLMSAFITNTVAILMCFLMLVPAV